jgi:2,3-bisphosphoglycerate-independent phosphoglycerate mutase
MKNTKQPRPITLIILDGWGHRAEVDANAIAAAHKPNWDHLLKTCPHTLISGSGRCVGLPDGQMGNSEVGHLNIGAGRIVHQDLTRIDSAIADGSFFDNPIFISTLQHAIQTKKAVHVMGLLSDGGVHSHENHFFAFIKLAADLGVKELYLHLFLDGRDTPPRSAQSSILKLEQQCNKLQCGKIVSLIGRYFAMDRDKRWDRVEKAYHLLTNGTADYHAPTAIAGLANAYARNENDEFVCATAIHAANAAPVRMDDGDALFFMNFRADRAREITDAFVSPHFSAFERQYWPNLSAYVCLTEYDNRFPLPTAFPPVALTDLFADIVSAAGMKQLRIAETEKYAHVTFFFNGGIEEPVPGEDRKLIPSPKVATYDLQPEMSAPELTDSLIAAIDSNQYDVIICNFANPDMVGHTGNFNATVKAIETIDHCLGKIIQAIQVVGGECLITADHGNAEMMYDPKTKQPHTAHTSDPVPFIYVGRPAIICSQTGKLSDVAPTMLTLLNLPIPAAMTGKSLIQLI